MNSKPVIIESTEPKNLHEILSTTPYQCFPFVCNGSITGLLTRKAIEHALTIGEVPVFSYACVTDINSTVKEAADNFINSSHGFLIVIDSSKNVPVGILTLHDLLRAQAAVAE